MRTNTLGAAGPDVSAIGLGTMTFGQETDAPEAHRILDTYIAAGGTLVDTADVYAGGESEEIVGRWFAADPTRRNRVRIATKGRFAVPGQPGAGLSAEYLRRALDASLAPTGASRLGEDPGRGLEAGERRGTERTWALLDALREHADRLGRTQAGIALAWVAGRPGVASALVGARTVAQLQSTLDGGREPLDSDTRQALDELSAPVPPDYPYAFLTEIDPQA